MRLNKQFFFLTLIIIIYSCSSNDSILKINSDRNIKVEELEKNFKRVIGTGVLRGKGKTNFSSSFIFESSRNNSIIVFKDFLGRKQYAIEVKNDSIKYLNVRKNIDIPQKEFNLFFPVSDQLNADFFKNILWGDTEALNMIDIKLKNSYVIKTNLISIDGSNYLDEIVFLLNNDKQNYTLKFNKRNFE